GFEAERDPTRILVQEAESLTDLSAENSHSLRGEKRPAMRGSTCCAIALYPRFETRGRSEARSTSGSRTTTAAPARFMSSASAARGERSRMRPRVYGPRSLILTTTERPLSRFVTFAKEASGSERCAAVAVTVSRISPLAGCLPTRLYQAAFPSCPVPAERPRRQQESGTPLARSAARSEPAAAKGRCRAR